MGTEHLTHAAEACGFAVAQLDMASLPFAEQLQVRHSRLWGASDCLSKSTESSACLTASRPSMHPTLVTWRPNPVQAVANSSVLVNVHGAAMTWLLALPPWGVAVELMPYKFDQAALYYHVHGNFAAAAGRTHFVWHNTNVWHASAGTLCCVSELHQHWYFPHRRSGHWMRSGGSSSIHRFRLRLPSVSRHQVWRVWTTTRTTTCAWCPGRHSALWQLRLRLCKYRRSTATSMRQ